MPFLIPSSLLISPGSSLFSSVFIRQASSPSLLEEGDDMIPGLENFGRKSIKTKAGDICVVRWSKPSGDYIMNFYRPKEVLCKKTEFGGHTRWPQGRGAPSTLVVSSCIFQTAINFPNFLNIPKQRKIATGKFWSRFTYRTTYLFLFGV